MPCSFHRAVFKVCFLLAFILTGWEANAESGFAVTEIQKKVRDFPVDSIHLDSPLDYYLSRAWVRMTGKARYWRTISSSKFNFHSDEADEVVNDDLRNNILDEKILHIVTYKDSVAVVITLDDPYYLINHCWIENGKWVNGGQDLATDKAELENKVTRSLTENYTNLPRIGIIANIPESVAPFSEFLANISASPEEYILTKLRNHRLVINGEYHHRKVSWDMLQRLVSRPEFADVCGTVFMELPSWRQATMDSFFEKDTLDVRLVYDILRDEQPFGWPERGECELLCKLYEINKTLSDDKKIKVVLTDYQIPYSRMESREDTIGKEDRNTHMADVVEEYLANSDDDRNALFLVGCAHVYKSDNAGIASTPRGMERAHTAGAQLSRRLGRDNVFGIFQHVLPGDNSGNNKMPIRGGIFDRAFEINGNRPVGFDLADSPFGEEPFDGIYEIKYRTATGRYADNFDGYIFLCPIHAEKREQPLNEIYTEEFVQEIKRRVKVLGWERRIQQWIGGGIDALTPEHFIQ